MQHLNARSLTILLLVLAVIVLGASSLAVKTARAEVNAALTLGKTVIGEGDDFSTKVIGIPWNMSTDPYPGASTVFRQDVNKNTIQVEDGRWKFTSTDTNGGGNVPLIWMLWSGIQDTQKILRIGDRYPINTDQYKLLSMYLCSERQESGIFQWFHTRAPHDLGNPSKSGWTNGFAINQGCHFYSLDMTKYPIFSGGWQETSFGYPKGLRLAPQFLSNANTDFELDWIRLTTIDTSNSVPIQWSGVSPGANLHFYASRTGCGGEAIKLGTQNAGSSSGTFNWGSSLQYWSTGRPYAIPEALEPDLYSIYMLVNDTGSPVCSGDQLEIRPAPIVRINKPSPLSGPDFATEHLSDTWGFSNSSDVLDTNDITNISFKDGLFEGRTTGEGVWLLLNDEAPSINTAKYKYVSVRMRVEGTQSLADGWVARYFWWNVGPGVDPSGIAALPVFEGWHTYTVNLKEALMLSINPVDWEGTPNGFRFDPIEPQSAKQYDFFVDYVVLTGNESINAGEFFELIVDVDSGHATSLTLYYDTDTNFANGRFQIETSSPLNFFGMEGSFNAFLPLISRENLPPGLNELPPLPGETLLWDTGGVQPGTYYIAAEVSDGVNSVVWYSDIPMIIK